MFSVVVLGVAVANGNSQFQAGLQAMQVHPDERVAYAGRMSERLFHHPRRLQQGNCDCPGMAALQEAGNGLQAQMEEDPMAAIVASQKLVCDHRATYECMAPCMDTQEPSSSMNLDCICSPCGDALLSATASLMGAFMLMASPVDVQEKFATQVMVEVCSPDMLSLAECMQCEECKDAMSSSGDGSMTMGVPADQEECMCGSCRRATIGAAVAMTDAGKDHEACLNTTILHCYGSSSSTCSSMMNVTAEMQSSIDAMCSAADAEAALVAVVDPIIAEFNANYEYPPTNRGQMCALTTAAKTSTTTATADTANTAMAMSIVPVVAALVW
mmetsp:Transcript_19425/g.44650  ORF Transcript_19425/g.44650 Transcript_19425/m.44650 type:complete len:328 (-) Transcript_19425:222-1205(-)